MGLVGRARVRLSACYCCGRISAVLRRNHKREKPRATRRLAREKCDLVACSREAVDGMGSVFITRERRKTLKR